MRNYKKETKLQFGSGTHILKDYINIDLIKEFGAQVAWDMNKLPYPFPDNYADEILCEMTLEHIKTPTKAIDEFHRIIKQNGTVKIIAPHFSHAASLVADWHVSIFNVEYFWKRLNIDMDLWGNKLDAIHWSPFNIQKRWNDVKVELIFPKGCLNILSWPWQVIFGKNKILQGIYEHFFSTIYRARDIHVTFKNERI